MEHNLLKHYKEEHFKAVEAATTYEELSGVALDVLKSMPQPVIAVSGPISTGGAGNITQNLIIFEKTIQKLLDQGHNVFNNINPFEKTIQTLRQKFGKHPKEQNQILLDKFYFAIYTSGYIKKIYFIPGWESSHGATWEREIAKRYGIEIEDLPKDFLEQ